MEAPAKVLELDKVLAKPLQAKVVSVKVIVAAIIPEDLEAGKEVLMQQDQVLVAVLDKAQVARMEVPELESAQEWAQAQQL